MNKNALVILKKSSYALYFLDRHHHKDNMLDWMSTKEKQSFKRTHEKHEESLKSVIATLKLYGVRSKVLIRGRHIDCSDYDIIITVGGDGTFLEAARLITKQPILGVNSDPEWSVGQLTSCNKNTFAKLIEQFVKNKSKIRKIPRLTVKSKFLENPSNVLNDILICHKNPAAMSRYNIKINSKNEEHRSSGIWISPAAGSTGAIYSAGGKLLPITSTKWQYLARELYSGRGNQYQLNGGVLNANASIKLTSLMREGVMFLDGSHHCVPLPYGQTVTFSQSKYPLNMIVG